MFEHHFFVEVGKTQIPLIETLAVLCIYFDSENLLCGNVALEDYFEKLYPRK